MIRHLSIATLMLWSAPLDAGGFIELPPGSCSGSDDTAVISAAIATASAVGGTVLIPATAAKCKVSAGFTLPEPIGIFGAGPGAQIIGTLPSNVDLFRVAPTVGPIFRDGYAIDSLTIDIDGGRNAVLIDTTGCNCYIGNSSFNRINTLGSTSLSGASIAVTGQASPYHGLFGSTFNDNALISAGTTLVQSAYYFSNFGDNNHIDGGVTTGAGLSLFMEQVPGAGGFSLSGSMLTACGGVYITRAVEPILRDFQIETLPYNTGSPCTSLTGAAVHLGEIADPSKKVSAAVIGPGQVQIVAGSVSYSSAVILANSDSTKIDGLRATNSVAGSTIGIWILSSSTKTHFGSAMLMSGWTTNYLDGGIGTTHPSLAAGAP